MCHHCSPIHLQALLSDHLSWMRVQRKKERFGKVLPLAQLRGAEPPTATSETPSAAPAAISSPQAQAGRGQDHFHWAPASPPGAQCSRMQSSMRYEAGYGCV